MAYRRNGDSIDIAANMPDARPGGAISWATARADDRAPDGAERTGHAVAHRDANGKVTVNVRLDG